MRFKKFVGLAAAVGVLGGTVAIGTTAPVTADHGGSDPVGLHNTTAGYEDCSDVPGLDGAAAWHFVAPPVSKTEFLRIDLRIDDEWLENLASIPHPTSGHAYVSPPPGKALTDLQDGLFHISGSTKKVRLSHLCEGETPPNTPDITVTKTAEVSKSIEWDWSLAKSIDEDGGPRLIEGPALEVDYLLEWEKLGPKTSSYVVSGEITVSNGNDVVATVSDIEDLLDGFDCTVDFDGPEEVTETGGDLTATYECLPGFAPDESGFYDADDLADAIVLADNNLAIVTYSYDGSEGDLEEYGDVDVDHTEVEVVEEKYATADIVDDAGTPLNLHDDIVVAEATDESGFFRYTLEFPITSFECSIESFTNTATLTSEDLILDDDVTVTFGECTQFGRTPGYWFNAPAGLRQTKAALDDLLDDYPNVLDGIGINSHSSPKEIKNFHNKANCRRDCLTLLQSHFIATAMNVRTNSAFAAQSVIAPVVGCITMPDLLDYIDDEFGNYSNKDWKTFLDSINNNKAFAC
jgi:hypothetical protein